MDWRYGPSSSIPALTIPPKLKKERNEKKKNRKKSIYSQFWPKRKISICPSLPIAVPQFIER
jgi:hypothetical protein